MADKFTPYPYTDDFADKDPEQCILCHRHTTQHLRDGRCITEENIIAMLQDMEIITRQRGAFIRNTDGQPMTLLPSAVWEEGCWTLTIIATTTPQEYDLMQMQDSTGVWHTVYLRREGPSVGYERYELVEHERPEEEPIP